ncbi:FAD-dependent oxidoreductase [Streptomyces morookaense]|uniref:FAD-dependent monooxygenase n=1 Tax=Streptomyces morookaense TaxID=1970 RepID=A0A7Y7E7Q6_STRMO|nr:FAD-dependent monooxygenase [Streptomyces morookaense]NVK79203.1 FAD-dependent monooxygenase [Streptomyces morookaense]GHF27783.1 oxygenase [Streptomyces morookaense]
MTESPKVLVVGAGPVGLVTGIELLRRGVAVRLVDRSERPNPHSKAIALWPRGIEALARYGAAEELHRRGVVLRAQNYHSQGRRVARLAFGGLRRTRYPYALSIPQRETEGVLRDVFLGLGGAIEFGTSLTGFTQDGNGVEAALETGDGPRTERFDWLVGCDGAHSTVRDILGVPFRGSSYPQQFLLTDGPVRTSLAHDEVHYFMSPAGILVVVGLPGGLYRTFVSVAPGRSWEDAREAVQQAASERCPVPIELVGEQQTGVFRVHRKTADRFRSGRVLLAGDAAHIHSPAGGQGLNTGIEDAASLAWRLAGVCEGRYGDRVLDQWEAERLGVARAVVGDTDRQTRMWMMSGWRARARDAVLGAGERSGALNRVVVPRQAQLSFAYPAPRERAGRLRAGMRLPDVPLGGRWLRDELSSAAPLLLLFPGTGKHRKEVGGVAERFRKAHEDVRVVVVPDAADKAHALLGVKRPCAVLVRPDGAVAALRDPFDDELTAALPALAETATGGR